LPDAEEEEEEEEEGQEEEVGERGMEHRQSESQNQGELRPSGARVVTDPVKTLMLIFTAVWVLVLVGTILIFEFIVPFNPLNSFFLNSTLKGVLSLILAGVWVYLFASLRNVVMKRELRLSMGTTTDDRTRVSSG
jgi:hypothetical protein